MELQNRLIQIRKSTKLTQAKFAKKLKISPRAYASYEHGERDLPLSTATLLCKFYNVSADWLLFGHGSRHAEDIGESVEIASMAVLEYLTDKKISVSSEKTVLLIRYVFNHQRVNGQISPEYLNDYMRSAI